MGGCVGDKCGSDLRGTQSSFQYFQCLPSIPGVYRDGGTLTVPSVGTVQIWYSHHELLWLIWLKMHSLVNLKDMALNKINNRINFRTLSPASTNDPKCQDFKTMNGANGTNQRNNGKTRGADVDADLLAPQGIGCSVRLLWKISQWINFYGTACTDGALRLKHPRATSESAADAVCERNTISPNCAVYFKRDSKI